MAQQRVARTPDFDLIIPDGWDILESECEEDRLVLQSDEGDARLTVSIRRWNGELPSTKAQEAFKQFVELRREIEAELPQRELSDYEIDQGEGFWYSKWAGRDE